MGHVRRSIEERRDGSWRAAAFALVCYGVLATAVLVGARANPEWFVHFGSFSPITTEARAILGPHALVKPGPGQDGQTFWLMARDPLLTSPATPATYEDRPAYREQRVFYPLLAAPGRFFGERALVWALLTVNLAAVAFGAYWAAELAGLLGASSRLSLAFVLNPAVVVSVLYDTADALAIALVLCGLACWYRGTRSRVVWAAVAFALAVLTKEFMLLVPLVLSLAALVRRRRLDAVVVSAPSLLVVVLWGTYERARLGWPATRIVEFAWPFTGFRDAYVRYWQPFHRGGQAAIAIACVISMVIVVAGWSVWRSDLILAAVPFAVLFVCLSSQVLDVGVNAVRATGPALTLLPLGAAESLTHRGPARSGRNVR